MPKGWRRWAIWGVAGFIVLAALSGIVGNRADAVFVRSLSPAKRFANAELVVPVWEAALVFVLLLALQVVFFLALRTMVRRGVAARIAQIRADQDELDALGNAIKLVQMDDTLLRLLPRLAPAPNRGQAIEMLLTEFLRDATGVFGGDVSRGMILHVEGDQLAAWVGYQMPRETLERTRFPLVDTANRPQGVAKRTYQDGKLRVVHFSRVKGERGKFRPDSRDYKVLDHSRPHPPYRSFVTVAIAGDADRLGVLCFDSMSIDAFDLPEIQQFLGAISRRIAAAMTIYRQLEDARDDPN